LVFEKGSARYALLWTVLMYERGLFARKPSLVMLVCARGALDAAGLVSGA